MRRFVMTVVSVGALGLAPLVVLPVQAETGTTRTVSTTDPAGDVDSRLDIVFAKSRGNDDGTVTLTIRTAKRWRCQYLRDAVSQPEGGASSFLFWDFDQGADGTYDVSGVFRCEQGRLTFELRRSGHPRRTFLATRPNARSARVSFAFSELGASRVSMRAMSKVTGVIGGGAFVDEEDLATPLLVH